MRSGLEIDTAGNHWYYENDLLHRQDGPAFDGWEGKEWRINGKLHRLDGPSIIWRDGRRAWYLNGEEVKCKNQTEFEQYLKLKSFW